MLEVDITYSIANRYTPLDYQFKLTMPSSSTTGIFGISGAGKSTLLRLLAGLSSPISGYIKFKGNTWFSDQKNINLTPQNRHISLMFPDKQLFPNMSVIDNINYANHSGISIQSWLKQFELTHLAQRKPKYLSQGEQQRVAFLRALARKPQLLLLDEPFAAIHEELKPLYYKALQHFQQEWGMSVIIVSHNRQELNHLGQQQYELNNGQLIQD